MSEDTVSIDRLRIDALVERLEHMASGDLAQTLPLSPGHDLLDAIAFGINVLVGEIRWAHAVAAEADAKTAAELRAAKEQAEQADRAKTTFLRNLSHELRTPLSAILAISELLQVPDLASERRGELVSRIRANCHSLLGLIQGVLDLSAIEAGRLEVAAEPITPVSLAQEVVSSLEPQASAKGLGLRLHSELGPDALVLTDPRHLRQILVNLVGNALKFTEEGEVVVLMSRGSGGELLVDVRDTGIGIDPVAHDRVFESFFQAAPTQAARLGGTGLGLALARRLAETLGAQLSLLASQPARGSTFRLVLPGGSADLPAPKPIPATRDPSAPLMGKRLLLAEDNPDIADSLAELLRLHGAEVSVARNGLEAVEQAQAEKIGVVLMDLGMPIMDGLEAARTLRAQGFPGMIIALTAYAVSDDRARCLQAGCDGYVPKPVEVTRLVEEILACRPSR